MFSLISSSRADGDVVLFNRDGLAFLDPTHALDWRIVYSMEFMLQGNMLVMTISKLVLLNSICEAE